MVDDDLPITVEDLYQLEFDLRDAVKKKEPEITEEQLEALMKKFTRRLNLERQALRAKDFLGV